MKLSDQLSLVLIDNAAPKPPHIPQDMPQPEPCCHANLAFVIAHSRSSLSSFQGSAEIPHPSTASPPKAPLGFKLETDEQHTRRSKRRRFAFENYFGWHIISSLLYESRGLQGDLVVKTPCYTPGRAPVRETKPEKLIRGR